MNITASSELPETYKVVIHAKIEIFFELKLVY